MNLLHIDSSILGPNSVSRKLSADIVAAERGRHPGLEVVYRDLAAEPLGHLSAAHLGAAPAEAHAGDIAQGKTMLEEFLAADIVVIGAPMYNFNIPSQLKAWIDRILVQGKTFRYTPEGPMGLAGDKTVIVASSRGGFYGPDTAAYSLDHQENYLRGVFGFIGIADTGFVRAEGVNVSPEQRARSIDAAADEIERIAA
jgi:FMN-dependent NADH-azoreductase